MLDARSRSGCVNEKLSREHLYLVGNDGIILYRYGKGMAAYRWLTRRHHPPFHGLEYNISVPSVCRVCGNSSTV